MNCEMCGGDRDPLNILPIKQPDGKLDTIACNQCAESSGTFCLKHQVPHIGFPDNTSACRPYIEEVVYDQGELIAGRLAGILESSDNPNFNKSVVDGWANLVSSSALSTKGFGRYPWLRSQPFYAVVARPVVTKAMRLGITPQEVLERVRENGVNVIISSTLFESAD